MLLATNLYDNQCLMIIWSFLCHQTETKWHEFERLFIWGLVLAYKQKHPVVGIYFPLWNKKANYLSGLISIAGWNSLSNLY